MEPKKRAIVDSWGSRSLLVLPVSKKEAERLEKELNKSPFWGVVSIEYYPVKGNMGCVVTSSPNSRDGFAWLQEYWERNGYTVEMPPEQNETTTRNRKPSFQKPLVEHMRSITVINER